LENEETGRTRKT